MTTTKPKKKKIAAHAVPVEPSPVVATTAAAKNDAPLGAPIESVDYLTQLRDWFAATSLQGLLASAARGAGFTDATLIATAAYRYADAMLAAREAKPST